MFERQVQHRVRVQVVNVLVAVIMGSQLFSPNAQATSPASPTSQGLTPRVWLPLVLKNFPPPSTISRYMNTTNWQSLYDLGCSRGQVAPPGQDTLIILDFGYPAYENQQYGAYLLTPYEFRSIGQIATGVEGFIFGYYACSPSDVHLTLAVGVNNNGSGVTREHGIAWAQMVNDLNAYIDAPPAYTAKLTAWGATDAEPDFGSATATRDWVEGFAATYSGRTRYVNFGSCDGCAYRDCPSCIPDNGWSYDDVWYVSYGAIPAYPVPEIYRSDSVNADQWYRMSLWAYTHKAARMYFRGSLTQWNACAENRQIDPNACIFPGVTTDNTPSKGYQQLYNAINSDSRTSQSVDWSTDISWQK